MLAADEDIANRIVEVAKRRGSTVYQTVNDILEQALRVDSMGLALNDVIDNREKLEKAKNMGLTFTIERLLYEIMDIAHEQVEEKLGDLWLETGRWYGKYFSSKNSDAVKAFEEAMELLCQHDWPGNVRELENLVERLVILGGDEEIDAAALPADFHRTAATAPVAPQVTPLGLSFKDVVDQFETDLILQALEQTRWNKNRAAQLLGLNRTTLLEKIKKKGLDPTQH